jgi:spermidine synthase
MSKYFEEIDYRATPIGPISLRRRHIFSLKTDVYEVLLGDEHLMSSLFTASEIALARLGLAAIEGDELDVIVGGLGLGYTAQAALEHKNIRSLTVVELLDAVIDWHHKKLVPLTPPLTENPKCQLVQGDFFALSASKDGFDKTSPKRKYHAILIDIDHTPDWLLDQRSGQFYTEDGLQHLMSHLYPGGVMGLWSDAKTDETFVERLKKVFAEAWAEPVTFNNPLQDNKPFTQTVYLARKAAS